MSDENLRRTPVRTGAPSTPSRGLTWVGVAFAVLGTGFSVAGLALSWSGSSGPWTSLGIAFVAVALACLGLGAARENRRQGADDRPTG